MLDEGLEGDSPEESEKKPRTYVSNVPQNDPDKLARELERLKKSLEKEQFFNRLLDQELKELKNNPASLSEPAYPDFSQRKRLSGGFIFFIFIVVVGVGGFFGYRWYTREPVNNFSLEDPTPAISDTTAEAQTKLNSVPAGTPKFNSDPVIDSNDIIAKKTTPPDDYTPPADEQTTEDVKKDPPKREEKKKPEPIAQDNTEEDLPLENKPASKPTKPVIQPQSTGSTPANNQPTNQTTNKPATNTTPPPANSKPSATGLTDVNGIMTPPLTTKRVLGIYTNATKANFYKAPDEGTMMTSFLSPLNPARVGALAEQNGFIYVEYTTPTYYTIKGWLSKKDLKRAD